MSSTTKIDKKSPNSNNLLEGGIIDVQSTAFKQMTQSFTDMGFVFLIPKTFKNFSYGQKRKKLVQVVKQVQSQPSRIQTGSSYCVCLGRRCTGQEMKCQANALTLSGLE